MPLTSLTEAFALLRQAPRTVRELVAELIGIVLTSKNPALMARKAVEAIRTKAIDEALKHEFSSPPPLPSPKAVLSPVTAPPITVPPPKPSHGATKK